MRERKTITIGYSFQEAYVQIGLYASDMEEPVLLQQSDSGGKLHIPICICKLWNSNQWLFGEEAVTAGKESHGTLVENLLQLCEKGEPVVVDDVPYMPEELLSIFITRTLNLLHRSTNLEQIAAMTFVFPTLSMKLLQSMRTIMHRLPIADERLFLLEEKESFYYFVTHQKRELWNNEVLLLDARKDTLRIWSLSRVNAAHVQPFVVTEEAVRQFSFGNKDAGTDAQLKQLLEELIQKRLISCILLTGHAFEGGWMQETKKLICRGRKVFFADHIAMQGACYRGVETRAGGSDHRQFYMGQHQLKNHLGLYVWNGRDRQYCRLVWAGRNWYEVSASHVFLVDNCEELCLQMDAASEDKKSIRKYISLDWLPKRPNLATKIRVDVVYEYADSAQITVTDLGLGELFPASGKSVTEQMGG